MVGVVDIPNELVRLTSTTPICSFINSSSVPGQRGNPSQSAGIHSSGLCRTWLRICMAFPDLCPHPGEAASSPGSAAAASSPGPSAAASSPGPASAALSPGPAAASSSPDHASAAWSPPFFVALFLNGKSCTCHISSRCSLGRFCIPEAAVAEAPP